MDEKFKVNNRKKDFDIKRIFKVNNIQGIGYNYATYRVMQNYFDNVMSLLNIGLYQKGIIYGYKNSLKVSISDNLIVVEPGMAIDNKGGLIYVPKTSLAIQDKGTGYYNNGNTIHIFIKQVEEYTGFSEAQKKYPELGEIPYEITLGYEISYTTSYPNEDCILLAIIYIDYNEASIREAKNPFQPQNNEINLLDNTYIYPQNIFNKKIIETFSSLFQNFGNFLQKLSYKKQIFSPIVASSISYKLAIDLEKNNQSVYQLYQNIRLLVKNLLTIKDENPKISNCIFWKNIINLNQLFDSNDSNYDFFNINIQNPDDFFSKVKFHIDGISKLSINHEDEDCVKNEDNDNEEVHIDVFNEEIITDCVTIGRDPKNHIVINDNEYVSSVHLRVTYDDGFYIEDLNSTNYTFVDGEQLEPRRKKLVNSSKRIILATNDTVLNLNHKLIQDLKK